MGSPWSSQESDYLFTVRVERDCRLLFSEVNLLMDTELFRGFDGAGLRCTKGEKYSETMSERKFTVLNENLM